MKLQNRTPDSLKIDSSKYNRASVIVKGFNLMNDTLGLDIKPTGWVQGNKKDGQREKQANLWIIEPETKDPTTHLHIWQGAYVKHGHDHDIIEKPNKQRRLSVRCVRKK